MRAKTVFVILLSICIISNCFINMVSADIDISKIPNTNRTFSEYNSGFLSVTGYAKGNVKDRSEFIGTDKYRVVSNEEDFLQALEDAKSDKVEVIEITEDLKFLLKGLQ